MGDSNLEVLDVLSPQVYLPFESLPSGHVGLCLVSLDKVIQLSSDLGMVPLELG